MALEGNDLTIQNLILIIGNSLFTVMDIALSLVPWFLVSPQGFVLGPICFSLFINDLSLSVKADVLLFADDAAFIITGDTFDELVNKIKELFSDLTNYLKMNQLFPNSSKSKLMFFKSRPVPVLPDISFYGQFIEWVSEFKYLGVTITSSMSFAVHINNVSSKVSQVTGTFLNLRYIVPLRILKQLYYALVYPI